MLVLLLLVIAVAGFYAFAVWPRGESGPGTRRRRRSGDDAVIDPVVDDRPESLEGVLVAQLVDGEITRRQYRRAMAQLAARDDERSPMVVPQEGVAGDWPDD